MRGPSHPAWILIFYFVCFFLLMRSFGVEKWLSIVGALAVAFSSYFFVIIAAGHGGKTIAISYITLVAAGFYLIFRKKYGLGAIFVMFFTAMGFSIHPQMTYYLFMMIGVFYITELITHIREKKWKELGIATLVFGLSLGIGLGTGCSNIFANLEYAQESTRGGHSDLTEVKPGETASKGLDWDYATEWSYGIDETLSFLIPGIKGGSSNYPLGPDSHTCNAIKSLGYPASQARQFAENTPMYWGEQAFTAGNVYMGAIICFLFLFGCLIVRGPYKWALLASTVFAVLLGWGHNCMWLTNYFPLYNKFRAPSSILVVAEIAMPLLGFLAVNAMAKGEIPKEKLRKALFISGGVTAGICLIIALFGRSLFSFIGPNDSYYASRFTQKVMDAIAADRADLLISDAWRSLAFIAAAFVLLWLFISRKIKYGWMVAILGVLILADMWPVDRRYFSDRDFSAPRNTDTAYAMLPYEKELLEDDDPHFRVMNLTGNPFNEARTSYYLKSVGGYHAAKLRRYQDLIDQHLTKGNWDVVNMLNTKYFIVMDNEQPVARYNPGAYGNAWYVERIETADNARAESDALNEIDLATTAVVDKSFASFVTDPEPGIAPDAWVKLTSFSPKTLEYDSHSSQPGTVVFSEIYYPHGWKVSIDDQKVEHFRANYTLRALNVPAGDHHIRFTFDPDSVRKGDAIAIVCIVLMYLFILAVIGKLIYDCIKKQKNAAATN